MRLPSDYEFEKNNFHERYSDEERTIIGDNLDTVILPYTHAAVLGVTREEWRQGRRHTSRSCRGQYR